MPTGKQDSKKSEGDNMLAEPQMHKHITLTCGGNTKLMFPCPHRIKPLSTIGSNGELHKKTYGLQHSNLLLKS